MRPTAEPRSIMFKPGGAPFDVCVMASWYTWAGNLKIGQPAAVFRQRLVMAGLLIEHSMSGFKLASGFRPRG